MENVVTEFEFIRPLQSFKTVAGHNLYKGGIYSITRETKNFICINVKHGEEKVRKNEIDVLYELVNRNFNIKGW